MYSNVKLTPNSQIFAAAGASTMMENTQLPT
jgi:hypothetical protein